MIHWLLHDGIGQNLTASVLIGVPPLIWARIKVWPRWKEHERKVHELHQQMTSQLGSRGTPRSVRDPASDAASPGPAPRAGRRLG